MRVENSIMNISTFSELRIPDDGVLQVSFLVVLVVNVRHSESSTVPITPLEVVHKRPPKVTSYIDFIKSDSVNHILDITLIEIDSKSVMNSL